MCDQVFQFFFITFTELIIECLIVLNTIEASGLMTESIKVKGRWCYFQGMSKGQVMHKGIIFTTLIRLSFTLDSEWHVISNKKIVLIVYYFKHHVIHLSKIQICGELYTCICWIENNIFCILNFNHFQKLSIKCT